MLRFLSILMTECRVGTLGTDCLWQLELSWSIFNIVFLCAVQYHYLQSLLVVICLIQAFEHLWVLWTWRARAMRVVLCGHCAVVRASAGATRLMTAALPTCY